MRFALILHKRNGSEMHGTFAPVTPHTGSLSGENLVVRKQIVYNKI